MKYYDKKNSQIDQVDFYLCGNFSTKPNTTEFIEIKAKEKKNKRKPSHRLISQTAVTINPTMCKIDKYAWHEKIKYKSPWHTHKQLPVRIVSDYQFAKKKKE